MAKSYSWSAILKHLKAGTECACLAVFETCRACTIHEDLVKPDNQNSVISHCYFKMVAPFG